MMWRLARLCATPPAAATMLFKSCSNDVLTVRHATVRASVSSSTTTGNGSYVRGRDPKYAWYTDSDGDVGCA